MPKGDDNIEIFTISRFLVYATATMNMLTEKLTLPFINLLCQHVQDSRLKLNVSRICEVSVTKRQEMEKKPTCWAKLGFSCCMGLKRVGLGNFRSKFQLAGPIRKIEKKKEM